jgi:uncharacterized protein YceK
MRLTIICLTGAALVVIATGCGTMVNMTDPMFSAPSNEPSRAEKQIYGGVVNDVDVIGGAVYWKSDYAPTARPFAVVVGLIDLPLSLVADTITLPWTVAHQIEKSQTASESRPKEKPAKVDGDAPRGQRTDDSRFPARD